MLYRAYQAQRDMTMAMRAFAGLAVQHVDQLPDCLSENGSVRRLAAAYEILSRAALTHERPPFAIDTVVVDGRAVAVREEAAAVTPFGTLLHFAKDAGESQPAVLLVAPLSGHFATLLRNTVRTMLPEHDVYITDWHNARDVPAAHGPFGFDDYVDRLVDFLEVIGPDAHVVAVCQPCVAALVATAVMAEARHPAQPRSLTLMAGPIDTRVNPTAVNELATSKPISWFEQHLIATVPGRYAGAGRRVYPGFLQLAAFMGMNVGRHLTAQRELYTKLVNGERDRAEATKAFYDEYFAVLDLTAEFYLETVRLVFQEHCLPRGELRLHDRPVDPRALTRTALLTIEGEHDDICSVGQTVAAHDLCPGIRPHARRHHLQAVVGHYGVFSGTRWQNQIYPIVRNLILANA